MSLGTLGDAIVFEVSSSKILTWVNASRSQTPRWHTHEVYGAKPLKEFIGPGLDNFDMSVRLDINHGVDPTDQIKKIRDKATAGEVLQLTIGGVLIGDYVVTLVQEDHIRFSRAGTLVLANVKLTLEEYN